jgi:hypothetical protein
VLIKVSLKAACFLIKRAALGANESTHSEPSITDESHGNKTDDEGMHLFCGYIMLMLKNFRMC